MPVFAPQQLPPGYIEGFHTAASGFEGNHALYPGRCRSDDDTMDIVLTNNAGILIANVGANGIDTGTHSAGWWAQYVIADSNRVNPTAGLFSLSPTSPTLPSGYDKKRRVNWCYTTRFYVMNGQHGTANTAGRTGKHRQYLWKPFHTDNQLRALASGTATSYTSIDLTSFVPTQSSHLRMVKLLSVLSATDSGDAAHFTSTGNTPANSIYRHVAGDSSAGTAQSSMQFDMPIGDDSTISYKVVAASGGAVSVSVWVIGWTDEV